MASTYTNVLFQPKSEQYQPRFFPRYKACFGGKGLQLNRYFDDFDASKNGLVSSILNAQEHVPMVIGTYLNSGFSHR